MAAMRARTTATIDNLVWHALTGPQAPFAERVGDAVRYESAVGVFCALADSPNPDDWDALRSLVGPGSPAVFFRPLPLAVPPKWEISMTMPSCQMVAPTELATVPDVAIEPIRVRDELDDLITSARPGPWFARTDELGPAMDLPFLGIYEHDRLVAAAGIRLVTTDAAEISAVATHEAARGRGYARALVAELSRRIDRSGRLPLLHVLADNRSARASYERLGFLYRPDVLVTVLIAPA